MSKVLSKAANLSRRKTQKHTNDNSKERSESAASKTSSSSSSLSSKDSTPPLVPPKDIYPAMESKLESSTPLSSSNSDTHITTPKSPAPPIRHSARSRCSTPSSPDSPNNDRLIKSLLKQYKQLEVELNRFNSKKYNHNKNCGALKSNILRTSLLPFLRNGHKLNRYFPPHSKVFKSLTSVITAILLKWWNSLLCNLNTTSPNSASLSQNSPSTSNSTLFSSNPELYSVIPTSDRNAYLECISRIVSLEDWKTADADFHKQYSVLLTSTLEYCIDKMTNLKTLPLSVSAFMGKIFAYSYFDLPSVSNALLFLLNVKQSQFEATLKTLQSSESNEALLQLYQTFPQHLHYLINFQGIKVPSKRQSHFLNCVPPPAHPVKGIKEPNGSWVRRWFNCDSNVFNSFFRHYIDILQKTIPDPNDQVLLNAPGFTIIYSHVQQIFQVSITRISTNGKLQQPQTPQTPTKKNLAAMATDSSPPILLPSINIKHCDVYYNSIIKIFKTLRDIVHCSTQASPDGAIDYFTSSLIKFVDRSLVSISKEISVYEVNKNGLILNIIYEFINHLYNNMNVTAPLISWEFWLSCTFMMIKHTHSIQIILKNLSFLYNIWDMIPESLSNIKEISNQPPYFAWITNLNESFKVNYINWIISDQNFQKFVVHWNPLVRSYYIRFLVWRIVGINNYQSSAMIQITKHVQRNFDKAFEALSSFTFHNTQEGNLKLDFTPDNPLVNRKIGIMPINVKEDSGLVLHDESSPQEFMPTTSLKNSELRKTHSYEVFDEAIYTCSSLPTSPIEGSEERSDSKKQSSKSLVTSIGKFFKYLSTDDHSEEEIKSQAESDNNDFFKYRRKSVSMSSLSTNYSSIKSRSSSPSLMSFKSTPTSITDSTSSSVSDVDSTKYSEGNGGSQPPEFARLPEEISRPIYKFDIVMDHESMNEKYMMIHQKNLRVERLRNQRLQGGETHLTELPVNRGQVINFPAKPKIPMISIFINNDPYNKFYIHDDEDGLFIEDVTNEDEDEVNTIKLSNNDELFQTHKISSRNIIDMINLGRSLNEVNSMIDEFKNYLHKRIEIDQFNQQLHFSSEFHEFNYFKRIIPFLSVDSSNELKLLNAS